MNKGARKSSFREAEKKLLNLIDHLENRLEKTDEAADEAKKIHQELQKLKESK